MSDANPFDDRPDLFEIICERRGWNAKSLAEFDDPNYDKLLDMDLMVEHLHRIRQSGELIVVLPDFDMDGITSGVLGFAGLAEMGFNVGLYIPDHSRGHGFSPYDIEQILDKYPDAKAVITCDTGIDSFAGTDHAVRAGLTVLITDHHLQIPRPNDGKQYLPAHAIVDPSRIDDGYKNKHICGAHVLYQVLVSYSRKHCPEKFDDVSLLRLFAGIGTVSDVMPIKWENRRLVVDSLSIAKLLHMQPSTDDQGERVMPDVNEATLMHLLKSHPHHPIFVAAFDGMARVIAHFSTIGKLRTVDDLDEGFYGFYLAPAFNAIRRMEGPMEDAFGSFFSPDPADKDAKIAAIIAQNDLRKELVKVHFAELMESDQPYAPFVYTTTTAARGMLGLLANQVMEMTGLPAAVLFDHEQDGQELSGSCRAPGWVAFNSLLNANGFHAAGHEQAFGVRVKDHDDLKRLHDVLETQIPAIVEQIVDSGDSVEKAPDLRLGSTDDCDADIVGQSGVDDLIELARRIETLAPFGHGFEEPAIEVVADIAECHVDVIGAKEDHLRISLPSGVRCLLWNEADRLLDLKELAQEPLDADRMVRMTGAVKLNHYMGNTSANFHMRGIQYAAR